VERAHDESPEESVNGWNGLSRVGFVTSMPQHDRDFQGIVVWSMVLPFIGTVIGFLIGYWLWPSLKNVLMAIGFVVGQYAAVRFGRQAGIYKVFLIAVLGWILGGLSGFAVGVLAGLLFLNRGWLLQQVKAIWSHIQ